MIDFAIVALPRSGTAWLSNLLTTNDVICWHDPLAYKFRPEEVVKMNGGFSDTGMGFYPGIVNRIQKRIVISRGRAKCEESLHRIGVDLPFLDLLESSIKEVNADITVDFDDLFEYKTSNMIYEFCIGERLSKERHALMRELDVQNRSAKL